MANLKIKNNDTYSEISQGTNTAIVVNETGEVEIPGLDLKSDLASTDAGKGAALVGFKQEGVGSVPRTAEDKVREWVSVKDFGAVGDGVTDDTAAIQAAIDYAATKNTAVLLNGNEYLCNSQLILQSGTIIFGPGKLISGPISGFPIETHLGFLYGLEKDNITIKDVNVDISSWASLPSGIASVRSILCRRGSKFCIEGCEINTTGGGFAFIGCKDITIQNNTIISATPGDSDSSFADGMIDVWVEFNIDAERCIISNNIIKANGFGRWGIMVTGLTFETNVMEVKSFCVSNNIIEDTFYDGIWVFGRNSLLDGVTVTGNIIKNVRQGIRVSDATNFAVVGNSVSNTTEAGIYLFSETSYGGVFGATGGTVSGNILKDVASGAGTPPAIWISDNSSRNAITGNNIVGNTHYYGVFVNSNALNNLVASNNVEPGRSSSLVYLNSQTKHDGHSYTPTLSNISNIASFSLNSARSVITSNCAIVFFQVQLTPTSSGVFTQLGITLPFPSDISTYNLLGSASQTTGEAALISTDDVNNRAVLIFTPSSTASRTIAGSFMYPIRP